MSDAKMLQIYTAESSGLGPMLLGSVEILTKANIQGLYSVLSIREMSFWGGQECRSYITLCRYFSIAESPVASRRSSCLPDWLPSLS